MAILACLFLVVLRTDQEVLQGQRYKQVEERVSILVVTVYHLGWEMSDMLRHGSLDKLSDITQSLKTILKLRNELASEDGDPNDPQFIKTRDTLVQGLRVAADVLRTCLKKTLTVQAATTGQNFTKERRQIGVELDRTYAAMQTVLSKSQDEMVEANLRKQAELLRMQAYILFAGLVISISLAVLLAGFFMKSIVKRLAVITDNTRRLPEGLPLNPGLKGADELAAVDRAFHRMAYALEQTKERERALFDNASDVICVVDSQGKFSRINPASLEVWGIGPDEVLGSPLIQLVYSEDRDAVLKAINQAQSESPSLEFECRLQSKHQTWMETLWSVYWSESEESLFCVVHDISERKKLERMKQEFLAMVSHDLRSPLSSIAGVFELLGRGRYGELPPPAVEKVAMASRNVSRLLTMVNDLLDMEKLDAGQLELSLRPVALNELMERCLQEVATVAEQRGVRLEHEVSGGEAQIDGDRIIQVVVNLLSNAIKFSPEGAVVRLSASTDGELLKIKVEDQGRGVPPEFREAIFERFKQVEAADGKPKSGTGLGLPICKQLVELHGGTIGVDSEEGVGSCFWLRLPLTPALVKVTDGEATVRMAAVRASLNENSAGQSIASDSLESTAPARQRFSLRNDLCLLHKGLLLVTVPVLFELILVGLLTVVLVQVNQEKAYERYLHSVTYYATKVVADFMKVGRAVSGPRSEEAWRSFQTAGLDAGLQIEKLRAQTSRVPSLAREFQDFERTYKKGLAYFVHVQERSKGKPYSRALADDVFADRESLGPICDQLGAHLVMTMGIVDDMQSTSPERQGQLRRQQGMLLTAGVAVNVVLSLILAIFFGKGITSRLSVLMENAELMSRERELRPPLAGRDEIAHLDRVFHAMVLALREAFRKERAVFDNSQDVICAIDEQGVFRQINSACLRMWGYTPEQLLNNSVLGLVSAGDYDSLMHQVSAAHLAERAVQFESRVECKDGSVKEILWSANWSADRKLLFCVAHDISKRKELERLKQEFLAMVSHDLRTPLTAINGVAKLMLAAALGPLPDLAKQKLQVVVKSVDRLLNLINDLLDIEKLDAGEMQLSIEPTSMVSVLERSSQALEGLARDKQIEIVVNSSEGKIAADGERLIQAIVNLLSNAIKFSPEGATVRLSAELSEGYCEFKVQDQGRGIPEAYRGVIFERFKQVENDDGKRARGTGLGLPISKKIVEQHGGIIGVDSEIGKGSTFWLRIPGVSAEALRECS
jgi:PAS domain S-box-containing protein